MEKDKSVAACQPKIKAFLQRDEFEYAGASGGWMDYLGYPQYNQLYQPFEHGVTVLDLILNKGNKATKYMKSFYKSNDFTLWGTQK